MSFRRRNLRCCWSPSANGRPSQTRRGVTLTELLIVIGLMAFLSSIALVGLWEAQEVARESRARSQVQRIEALLMERWDDYASRAVPIRISRVNVASVVGTASSDSNRASFERARVNALRETARFELPDRISDVAAANYPTSTAAPLRVALAGGSAPSLQTGYRRALDVTNTTTPWTPKFQGAECLYVILAATYKGDENGLTFFKPSEIGDKDGDGRPEILDPWGNPIEFIRWGSGLDSPLHSRKEVQTIAIYGSPNDGKFQLFFANTPASKSAELDFDADPTEVETAIDGILGPNVLDNATEPAVQGPIGGPWTVRFVGSADMLVGSLSVTDPLTGASPFQSVRVTTDFVDPFDPLEAWGGGPPLHPIVVSAGRDGKYGIFGLIDPDDTTSTVPFVNYSQYNFGAAAPPLAATDPPNNPYRLVVDPQTGNTNGRLLGDSFDYDSDNAVSGADRGPSTDNVSNHLNDASA